MRSAPWCIVILFNNSPGMSVISGPKGRQFDARGAVRLATLRHVNILNQSVHCQTMLLALGLAGAATPAFAQVLNEPLLAEVRALAREAASVGAPAGARIEVTTGALDTRLTLAPCARITPSLLPGARSAGATRVGLRCSDGGARWSVTLPVTVKVFAPAVVAQGTLPAGTVLEAGQLKMAEVDWASDSTSAYPQAEAVIGRTLARPLPSGRSLRQADLRPHQWFAAGDTVLIVANGGGFQVSVEGQALSNGIEGQTARARTENGHIVSGLPKAERRIEVSL
jgi:flagella basal body P-ring formation protein FlgA